MNWDYYTGVCSAPDFQKMWDLARYLNQKRITHGLFFSFRGIGPGWMGGANLTPGCENEWAEMAASLPVYARNTQHVQFTLAAPGNENHHRYPQGIGMSPHQYVATFHKLGQLLDANGRSDVRFVGPDLAYTSTSWMSAMMNDTFLTSKWAHSASTATRITAPARPVFMTSCNRRLMLTVASG
jgi:hypothetical protein